MNSIDRRMKLLESYATSMQRRTVSGLVALVASGKLSVRELTDEELERLAAGLGEMIDLHHLSDDELEAIIDGG